MQDEDEKQEDNERSFIKKTLKQFGKSENEADETHAQLGDVQRNVDEAEVKVNATRLRLYHEINK